MMQLRQIHLGRPGWRKVAAGLPALALIASGAALTATTDHESVDGSTVAQGTTAFPHRIEVPATPSREQSTYLQSAIAAPLPALALPAGTQALPAFGPVQGNAATGGGSVVLDRSGIPAPALAAYRLAAKLLSTADAACHLDWAIPAAIGRVESNHARFGGNVLDAKGVATPGIIGLPLNGSNGTARIGDTDKGIWDRDTTYDRAVGPMQFIPGTWRAVGQDADGDGVANPQDMNDAATATGVYLCSGGGDLSSDADLYKAIFRYNQSDSYVRTVMNLAKAYRAGVTELPVSQLPAATTSSTGTNADSGFGTPGGPVQAAPKPTTARTTPPAQAGGTPSGSSSSSSSSRPPVALPRPSSTPSSASVPPALPPAVEAPVASVSSAVQTQVVQPVVTTLQRVTITLLQVLGGLLRPVTDALLPAAPADLSKVVKGPASDPIYGQACFVDTGQKTLLTNLPIYQQVRCPANTK